MMSLLKLQTWCAAVAASLLAVSTAAAQTQIRPWNLLTDPFEFGHDLQFFKYADVTDFGGGPPPHEGWFATYDRAYLAVTRPDASVASGELDMTWGNRWEVGYMTHENHGWLGTIFHVSGPGIIVRDFVQELDAAPTDTPPTNHITVDTTRNVATLNSWDLNKTFRLGPNYHGGFFEPYFGLRYMELRDLSFGATVTSTLTTQVIDKGNLDTKNRMLGGQVGGRFWRRRGRWIVSADAKAMVFQNWQSLVGRTETTIITYTGTTPPLTESFRQTIISPNSMDTSELALAMEIRAEAAFELTRDVSLRAGIEVLQFFKGVARGLDSFADNNEPFTAAGATFGVAVNR